MPTRFLALLLSWCLIVTPFHTLQASYSAKSFFNPDGTVSVSMVRSTVEAMAFFEKEATLLTSKVGRLRQEFSWYLTDAVWAEVEPELQKSLGVMLDPLAAGKVVKTGSTPMSKVPNQTVAPPMGPLGTSPPAMTTPFGTPIPMVSPEAQLKTLWNQLQPLLEQLAGLEHIITQYQILLYQIWPQVKAPKDQLELGLLQFLQLNVHATARRTMGGAVETSLPDVLSMDPCRAV